MLPMGTLLAPPLPAGSFGIVLPNPFADGSALLLLGAFPCGAVAGGSFSEDLPLFSFSSEPLVLVLPVSTGALVCVCVLAFARLLTASSARWSLTPTFFFVLFSLKGLSSSSST